jgi:hypothetical protein
VREENVWLIVDTASDYVLLVVVAFCVLMRVWSSGDSVKLFGKVIDRREKTNKEWSGVECRRG